MKPNELIFHLNNPQVYSGKEINVVKKEFSNSQDVLNICLVFPDTYEIGMSHYGIKLLYHTLNNMEGVNAERCFLPEKESIQAFQEHEVRLFSIENRKPLSDFDLIGFSVLSEMNFTNILQVLVLACIPLKSNDRANGFPLIAAGGISIVNPEPLRQFVDMFAFGDGEVIFPDMIETLAGAKRNGTEKMDVLRALSKIAGVYVPALHPVEKKGLFHVPTIDDGPIKKRVLKRIDESFNYEKMIVPLGNAVFNRLDVEIARGCPQSCRFCQAKSYYAPYRPKSLENNLSFIEKSLDGTGFENFSLSTLSSGDYPYLPELLEEIPRMMSSGISMSVSSLRPSTLSRQMLSTISLFRRTGLTIVPEAGTPRLRRVINKNVTDEDISRAVDLALEHNWKKIKLYFMIGLPTETMDDIDGIIEIIEGVIRKAKEKKKHIGIHVSFSSFVPKPHTPLQWAARESLESLKNKRAYIIQALKKYRKMDLDFHLLEKGIVETLLARGDDRVGDLLLETFKEGEIFTAWDSEFHYSVWAKWIDEMNLWWMADEIPVDEVLPWDFVQVNFHRDALAKEYRQAKAATPTPSCWDLDCEECRACMLPFKKKWARDEARQQKSAEQSAGSFTNGDIVYQRVRLFYRKEGDFRFFSHLSLVKYLERLLRRSGIRCKFSEGFHPRMKISSLPPLPVYAGSECEVVELFMDSKFDGPKILDRLNRQGAELTIDHASLYPDGAQLTKDIHSIVYEIVVENPETFVEDLRQLADPHDEIHVMPGALRLVISYSHQGAERFGKMYRVVDPERSNTRGLTRKKVIFKSDL